MSERYQVTIEEGLENAGYKISTKCWLDDYDREFRQARQSWKDIVTEQTKGMSFHEIMATAIEMPFHYPAGREINESDVKASDTDTAIYVLARQAGEGHNRKNEKGDYQLADIEYRNLKFLAQTYSNTILIINVSSPVDLVFMDEITGIDAVVFSAPGGMEGGNALADVAGVMKRVLNGLESMRIELRK